MQFIVNIARRLNVSFLSPVSQVPLKRAFVSVQSLGVIPDLGPVALAGAFVLLVCTLFHRIREEAAEQKMASTNGTSTYRHRCAHSVVNVAWTATS